MRIIYNYLKRQHAATMVMLLYYYYVSNSRDLVIYGIWWALSSQSVFPQFLLRVFEIRCGVCATLIEASLRFAIKIFQRRSL